MPYLSGLRDARRLHLVDLPTHRCRTCTAPIEVERVEITTFGEAAQRLRHWLWGRHRGCARCLSTTRPTLMVGEDFLILGRIGGWWW